MYLPGLLISCFLILMAISCNTCSITLPTRSALASHYHRHHRHPIPDRAHVREEFHPHLNGTSCLPPSFTFKKSHKSYLALIYDAHGTERQEGDLPFVPPHHSHNWEPFKSRPNFEFAEYVFEREQSSKSSINDLLKIIAAQRVLDGEASADGGFADDCDEILATIDSIDLGPDDWTSFIVRYTGAVDESSPTWKRQEYVIHARNIREAYHTTLANRDLSGKFDARPYKRWIKGKRTYSNLMSSTWAWKKAVRFYPHLSHIYSLIVSLFQTQIAEDPQAHGAMLVPIILGADKTTVSVATGNQEYHPVYTSPGIIHNDVRRAHRDALIPITFLATPKGYIKSSQK